ncbi:LysR family transcriptional regulator [Pacificoceanicola onchidii]|uniref:LysR family transcriptional regulator n=1 Tax=Pacificoceanicola onchidii TaxID=2562685 RepID=UPI0014560485|nr:LysR family transcriptional regulator [Pacificoceanicola onchidii]
MIDDFRGLAVFVAVTEAGSFSAAGRRLNLSTSVVSHHVSKLESKLGVSLFFRSTRALTLTSEGHKILDAAKRMVAAGTEAFDALSGELDQPVGTLRITIPAFGQCTSMHRAIWDFALEHPLVSMTVNSLDRQVDLVSEGYDLAIRLGKLADSTLKSKRIGRFRRVMVASPGYLAERAPIETIENLAQCDFVAFSMIKSAITMVRNGETATFEPERHRLEVDSIAAAIAAVKAGLGCQHLPESEILADLAEGSLVEVLPAWKLPDLGIYAVWPDSGPQKQLTRRLLDYLTEAAKGEADGPA